MDENNENNENYEDENADNIVTLKDEEGNDVTFELLDLIEYEGDNYVILLPYNEDSGEEGNEVVILKEDGMTEDNENTNYVTVEDEDALDKIFNIFKDKFKDEFNFDDEE